MRVLIVGCGYVGLALGAELARRGHETYGMRRTSAGLNALRAAGVKPLVGDITSPETLNRLPAAWEWVVNCVSGTTGGPGAYRATYVEGMRNLLSWLAPAPPRRL